jgi:signal transduction histidine kinase
MATLFFLRLIGLTVGTVVYLFLIALILGHRRPRTFERLLFMLVLALFFVYAGGLLEINSRIEYAVSPVPDTARLVYSLLIVIGLLVIPGLMVHAHLEFFEMAAPSTVPRWTKVLVLVPLYIVPALTFFVPFFGLRLVNRAGVRFGPRFGPLDQMTPRLVRLFPWTPEATFIFVAILLSLAIDLGVLNLKPAGRESALRSKTAEPHRRFFIWMASVSGLLLAMLMVAQAYRRFQTSEIEALSVALIATAVLPGVLFAYYALRHNFLDFGEQRNLLYALTATILGLLYLALVRRVSVWLEPMLPPEATAAILLFALIFIFEPVERMIGPALHRKFRERVDRLQRLTAELQAEARHGDLQMLISFAEGRIAEEFGLERVRLTVWSQEPGPQQPATQEIGTPLASPGGFGHSVCIPLMRNKARNKARNNESVGTLEAASSGVYLRGETTGALEFLAEQLPALLDLARLIEEKVRLERELAERERLALVGEMAASVSHNLRNPLGSMKTILQVQLENPDLPGAVRHDCGLVLGEVERMSQKLTQLLQFSRPASHSSTIDAARVARESVELIGRDALRRGVRVDFDGPANEVLVRASEDALNEVLSNLVLNAVEAQPDGGGVRVGVMPKNGVVEIMVQDDGPGISQGTHERIFDPFYTTKASGTGLGLSIVARRTNEMGGEVFCESPVSDGRGTRFRVRIPSAGDGAASQT